ncbi:hypothetical protein niasHT_007496 [Heterodera trifolii]|uniref:Homeobox domain-containing protein n=1 Tax=Heterodera trifolii TaxID=157864 RepID=A0ABD2LPC2_9BILA
MLKNDGVVANDSAFPYPTNTSGGGGAIAPGPLFPPLFPPNAIIPSSFASSPPIPPSPFSHSKTPKDELLLSADATAFGAACGDGLPAQFQMDSNGTTAAFPAAQFATADQRPNLCHQRSAQSAVAAQMAHAMAQQYGFASNCAASSAVFVPFGASTGAVPQLSSPAVSAASSAGGSELLLHRAAAAAAAASASYPMPNAAMSQQQQRCGNTASSSSHLYEPNFVSPLAHHPPASSRAGPSPSSSGPSSASSLSGAYSSSASSNCAAVPSGAAAMFFPQLYSANNCGNNDFYAYYHQSSHVPQCHHHSLLHHFGGAVAAAASVPQPPPVLLANNNNNGCSASSSSNCSELEHSGGGGTHQQMTNGGGTSWRGTTTFGEERRLKMMATIGGAAATAAAVSRRAESGTFPGLCPQPRHPVGPGTNNVRVRTKDTYRVVYSECQRLELEQEFDNGGKFITRERKAALSARLRLTERQIKIWFQNRRAKERRRNGRRTQHSAMDF